MLLSDINVLSLRLQYTFRSIIFLKSGFLGQNIGHRVIFNIRKKIIAKDLLLAEESGFHVFAGSKNLPLDWQSYDVMQSTEATFVGLYRRKNFLLSYSIDQPPSIIFLGVIFFRWWSLFLKALQSKQFFSALFSRNNFFTLKSYKSNGICSIGLKFGQQLV